MMSCKKVYGGQNDPYILLVYISISKILITIGMYKMHESKNSLPDAVNFQSYKKILSAAGFSFNHIMRPDTQQMFEHWKTCGYDLKGVKDTVEIIVNHKKKKGKNVLPIDCRQPVDNHFVNFVKQQPCEPGASAHSSLISKTSKIKSTPEVAEKHFKNLMRIIGAKK